MELQSLGLLLQQAAGLHDDPLSQGLVGSLGPHFHLVGRGMVRFRQPIHGLLDKIHILAQPQGGGQNAGACPVIYIVGFPHRLGLEAQGLQIRRAQQT